MKSAVGNHRRVVYVLVIVFVLDFLTKFVVDRYIPRMGWYFPFYPYGGLEVFKNFFGVEFSIVHATNRGAAWGILADYQPYLLLLRIVLVVAMSIYLFGFNKYKAWNIPLALIIAGAFGNVADYFIYGHVVDMFHFVFWRYDYPVFNVADSAITIGICWLFLTSWQQKP